MITRLGDEDKKMRSIIAKRWAKKMAMPADEIEAMLKMASVEVYEKYPFQVAVIKKTVRGKQIRGVGFSKYNLNDIKMGEKYAYKSELGKAKALSRAYSDFLGSVKETLRATALKGKKITINAAVVDESRDASTVVVNA